MNNDSLRNSKPKTYWATEAPDKLASELKDRIKSYQDWLRMSNRASTWLRSMSMTYGWDLDRPGVYSSRLTLQGKEGEVVSARANLFRAYLRSIHNTITASRVSYQCRAIADDARSTEAAQLGESLVDYYQSRAGGERACRDAVWLSLVFSEAYVSVTWDEDAGSELAIGDDGRIVRDGDIRFKAIAPYDIARDAFDDRDLPDWIAVRTTRSRWTMAARYPEYRDDVLKADRAKRWAGVFGDTSIDSAQYEGSDDLIDVWEFYHRPTEALPNGRASVLIAECIVADGPNPYEDMPLFTMAPLREPGTSQYYGESWDLIALQQAYDAIFSSLLTNQENFGLLNLWVPPGCEIDDELIQGGVRMFKSAVAPQPLNWNIQDVGKVGGLLESIVDVMNRVSGQNNATMGDPSGASSGKELAMMAQLAVQTVSAHQYNYAILFQGVGMAIIDLTRRFAKAERVIEMSGGLNANITRRFMSDELSFIRGMTVDLGAAGLRSAQGREAIADKLAALQALAPGPLQDAYMGWLTNGRPRPDFDGPQKEFALLQSENERLIGQPGDDAKPPMPGEHVEVLPTDNHAVHIKGHAAQLRDITLRRDPNAYQLVYQHLQEHDQTWLQMSLPTNPSGMALLAATGQMPHPAAQIVAAQQAAQAQMAMGGAPGPNPGNGPNPGPPGSDAGAPKEAGPPPPPTGSEPQQAQPPSAPPNPEAPQSLPQVPREAPAMA